jgi:hypothetical protein
MAGSYFTRCLIDECACACDKDLHTGRVELYEHMPSETSIDFHFRSLHIRVLPISEAQ